MPPTSCRRGSVPSPSAPLRTTAKSTPSGATAPAWKPAPPPCRSTSTPSSLRADRTRPRSTKSLNSLPTMAAPSAKPCAWLCPPQIPGTRRRSCNTAATASSRGTARPPWRSLTATRSAPSSTATACDPVASRSTTPAWSSPAPKPVSSTWIPTTSCTAAASAPAR